MRAADDDDLHNFNVLSWEQAPASGYAAEKPQPRPFDLNRHLRKDKTAFLSAAFLSAAFSGGKTWDAFAK
jgi:hypothetical protein